MLSTNFDEEELMEAHKVLIKNKLNFSFIKGFLAKFET